MVSHIIIPHQTEVSHNLFLHGGKKIQGKKGTVKHPFPFLRA